MVHVGTGGDPFHASARRLYESLGFYGYPVVDYTRATLSGGRGVPVDARIRCDVTGTTLRCLHDRTSSIC